MPLSSPHPSPLGKQASGAGMQWVPSQRAEQQSLSPMHAPPAVMQSAPPQTPALQAREQQSLASSQWVPSAKQ